MSPRVRSRLVLFLLFAPGVLLLAFAFGPRWAHDLAVWRFERGVAAAVPPGATLVTTDARFGLLSCCSNHCDVEVRSVLDAPSAGPELARAMALLHVDGPFGGAVLPWVYEVRDGRLVAWSEDGVEGPLQLERDADEAALVAFAEEAPTAEGTHRYVLTWSEQSYAEHDLWDLRCH